MASPVKCDLARAISLLLLGAGTTESIAAQEAPDNTENAPAGPTEQIVVIEQRRQGYSADTSSLSKLTEDLLDTPQSISVLTDQLLDDKGVTSLNEALRGVPGITLGAGEFSWQGNNPSIRGFSARDDMYLDGLRDFGSYTRDPFNLESVEVLLGPSSILFGRGSTGGAVNQVSKQPTRTPIDRASINIGSDSTVRGTLDFGRPIDLLGDGAFRLNVLAHEGEVADRNGARSERYAIAPSVSFGLDSATQFTLSYLKQTADDRPDYGLPWLYDAPAKVPRENFYGFNTDYLETDADIGTINLTHSFRENARLNATVRYADYQRSSRITEPLIIGAIPAGTPLENVSIYRYVFLGESEEDFLTAQTNATIKLQTGTIGHTVVTGIEAGRETSAPTFSFGIGAPETNLAFPTPTDAFTATSTEPRVQADTTGTTLAIYALDTMSFGNAWLVTVGARWDQFESDYRATRFTGPPTPFNAGDVSGTELIDQTDRMLSYRTAVVYKPAPRASLYLAASTSFNPSAQGLSFLSTGRGLGTSNAFLDPEENQSIEAGLKYSLAAGGLTLSSALFEITKTNARIPDPNNPGFNTLGGEQRVQGLAFDIAGLITPKLKLIAGYSWLDGTITDAGPGAVAGGGLANLPEHSATVWTDYAVAANVDVGFGVRYVADQLAQTGGTKAVPAYTLLDAMLRYRVSDSLTIKLNLTNLTNELYFDQLHPWHVVPGPGFTSMLAFNVTW